MGKKIIFTTFYHGLSPYGKRLLKLIDINLIGANRNKGEVVLSLRYHQKTVVTEYTVMVRAGQIDVRCNTL